MADTVQASLALQVTLLGYAMAEAIEDDENLGLLAVALTQLGDVLTTIQTQRVLQAAEPETEIASEPV